MASVPRTPAPKRDSRARVLDLLRRAPGLHVAEIARRLDLTWQGASHHLRALEAEGALRSVLLRRRRVYLLSDAPPEAAAVERALASPSAVRLARAVLGEPGLTVIELARRAGLSRRVAYHHALILRRVGLVNASGEPLRLAPAPTLATALGDR